jgi:hypothetical protein
MRPGRGWRGRRPGPGGGTAVAEPQELPPEPTDVRAEMPDGSVIPLALTYRGVWDGLHVWDAAPALPGRPKVIHVGVLPPLTVVRPRIRSAGAERVGPLDGEALPGADGR